MQPFKQLKKYQQAGVFCALCHRVSLRAKGTAAEFPREKARDNFTQ